MKDTDTNEVIFRAEAFTADGIIEEAGRIEKLIDAMDEEASNEELENLESPTN